MPADLQSAPFGRSGNLASTFKVRGLPYNTAPQFKQICWLPHTFDGQARHGAKRLARGPGRQRVELAFDVLDVAANRL